MKELHINPNRPRNPHDETAWLERDDAMIHHLDFEDNPDAPVGEQPAPLPDSASQTAVMDAPAVEAPVAEESVIESIIAPVFRPTPTVAPDHRPAAKVSLPDARDPADRLAAADEATPEAGLPPLIGALLTKLPHPAAAWSRAERVDWLRAAEDIFHLVYKTEGRIRIQPEE